MRADSLDDLIQRTEGVSAAFIRELLRKAALAAAHDASPAVEDRHLDDALHELATQGGELQRALLGVRPRSGAMQ